MVQELRSFSVQVRVSCPQLVSWLHLQSAEGGERVAVDPKVHGTVGEGARMRPKYLREVCQLEYMLGPLDKVSLEISCFGVFPKGHTPGKWCLIVDLSAPSGHSVKDAPKR